MDEKTISEIRDVLEEVVVSELKAIGLKVDALQRQIELSQQGFEARFEALRLEQSAARRELAVLRDENHRMRVELSLLRAGRKSSGLAETFSDSRAEASGRRFPFDS